MIQWESHEIPLDPMLEKVTKIFYEEASIKSCWTRRNQHFPIKDKFILLSKYVKNTRLDK